MVQKVTRDLVLQMLKKKKGEVEVEVVHVIDRRKVVVEAEVVAGVEVGVEVDLEAQKEAMEINLHLLQATVWVYLDSVLLPRRKI